MPEEDLAVVFILVEVEEAFETAVVVSFVREVLEQLPKMLVTVSLPATPSACRL